MGTGGCLECFKAETPGRCSYCGYPVDHTRQYPCFTDMKLSVAIATLDIDALESLLKENPAIVSLQDQNSHGTPLHIICSHSRPSPPLLSQNEDIQRRISIIKLLLRHGADINAPINNPVLTPLSFASEAKNVPISDLLRQNGAREPIIEGWML